MNQNLATAALNYVAVSSALTKRAIDELNVHRAAQQKAAALQPTLLQEMLQTGHLAEHQKQAGEAMLASHPETLQLLKLAIAKNVEQRELLKKYASELGRGEDENTTVVEKTAGDYDSLNDPYVGRRTSQRKASDVAILRVLDTPSR